MRGIAPVAVVPFLDAALDGMLDIARVLGDDLVNEVPDLPGANSPFVILYHCVGVADWWIGVMIGEQPPERDREAEFTASGTVADLEAAVEGVKRRVAAALDDMDPAAPIRHVGLVPGGSIARDWNRGEALIHTLEELAQHHGQMEITRDILLSS